MDLHTLLLPIRGLWNICADVTTMSLRKYSSMDHVLSEAISNIVNEAQEFNRYLKKMMDEPEWQMKPKNPRTGEAPSENDVVNATLAKIAPILGEIKALPPSVRHIFILMLILVEGEIPLVDILPEEEADQLRKVMEKMLPHIDELKQCVADNDMAKAKGIIDNIGIDGVFDDQDLKNWGKKDNFNSPRSVLERARKILNNNDKEKE